MVAGVSQAYESKSTRMMRHDAKAYLRRINIDIPKYIPGPNDQ